MIAGARKPKKFDRINCTNELRLACTCNGCTVAVRADSTHCHRLGLRRRPGCLARRRIQPARIRSSCLRHGLRGRALPRLTRQPGSHRRKRLGRSPNSEANPFQAAAASSIGAEPAPEYISSELISGGNEKKLIRPLLTCNGD